MNATRPITATLLLLGGVVAVIGYDALLRELHGPPLSLVTLLGILVAATCSSIAGFAFSALSGAILFHTVAAPVVAVQIMLWCSIAIQLASVLALRNGIDWRSLLQFLAGGVIGLPIGVFGLLHLGKGAFGSVFGVILIAYGAYRVWRQPARPLANSAAWNVVAGAAGGAIGGLAAFPGSVVTIWCGTKGWSKVRQRGVYQPYILIMQLLTVLLIGVLPKTPGIPTTFDPGVVAYAPAAVIGTVLGLRFFRSMTDRQFGVAINLLLIASGVGMEL